MKKPTSKRQRKVRAFITVELKPHVVSALKNFRAEVRRLEGILHDESFDYQTRLSLLNITLALIESAAVALRSAYLAEDL